MILHFYINYNCSYLINHFHLVTDVDPNFYARLKRETDDIAALKTKKPVNRQVFSSWSKFEQPIPNVEEHNQLPDFETLLCSAQGDILLKNIEVIFFFSMKYEVSNYRKSF